MLTKLFSFLRQPQQLNGPNPSPAALSDASDEELITVPADAYQAKIQQELDRFESDTDVHALPAIFHYWTGKYLGPALLENGHPGIDEFYAKYLFDAAARTPLPPRFVSIGAGNCDTEIRIAKLLVTMGLTDFTLECLELNPHMLERGRQDATANGIADYLMFTEADFNAWTPVGKYSGVIANHSLHHVVELEKLFDAIKSSLHSAGYFVTSDMIGRNGHQRWPEALTILNEFWERLPDTYRYNKLLKRQEPTYINWDCSNEGFEGIRAQDILPLLIERFDFPFFYGFANVISPFIDRCFGHNFDAESRSDQEFIDQVHAADEAGFRDGSLKPTQMLAVMSPVESKSHTYVRSLSPKMSVRVPD